MISESIVLRYVRALFETSAAEGMDDDVSQVLAGLQNLHNTVPQLRRVLINPSIPDQKKVQVLREIIGESIPPVLQRFLELLVEKRRTEVLASAARLFDRTLEQARGVRRAQIRTASPLTADQTERVRQVLSETLQAQVIVETQVDPSVVGGVQVRVGDLLMDGSLQGRLRQVRHELTLARPTRDEP